MNSDNLKVIISDEIEEVMRERGIQENEIKEVISDALDGAVHLHTNDGTRFLAKKGWVILLYMLNIQWKAIHIK